jgi:hypothetical protein
MADSSATIHPVIQDTGAGCPTSSGTLSAMSLESLSAISGMRSGLVVGGLLLWWVRRKKKV